MHMFIQLLNVCLWKHMGKCTVWKFLSALRRVGIYSCLKICSECNIYTLFDGLTYTCNACGYFAWCVIMSSHNEQNVHSYFILSHWIRDLLFHYYFIFSSHLAFTCSFQITSYMCSLSEHSIACIRSAWKYKNNIN